MKAINEMSMEELAAYAVTLDGWDWTLCGGMRPLGMAERVPDEDIDKLEQMTPEEFEEFKRDVVESGFRPDLGDNATLGCVLAMARKRGGAHAFLQPTKGGWIFLEYREGRQILTIYTTEAHALVAALVISTKE